MTLARIFGRSPFAPLQTHMNKVASCVNEITPLFNSLKQKNFTRLEEIAQKISNKEHEADLTKNDIRNNLPAGLFLPIARQTILEILSLQDNIADKAENAAVLLTFLPLEINPLFASDFEAFLNKNLETFQVAKKIIQELGELLESSFGGSEAEKVKKMVEEAAYKEHECDILQRTLIKKLLGNAQEMQVAHFYLWMKVVQELSGLSDESEKLANRVRMILEVK
jgi:uncharacterized protein